MVRLAVDQVRKAWGFESLPAHETTCRCMSEAHPVQGGSAVRVRPRCRMEVTRLDEDIALKATGGDEPLGGSSPSASALRSSNGRTWDFRSHSRGSIPLRSTRDRLSVEGSVWFTEVSQRTTCLYGVVGVLATLSRWRSRVQVPLEVRMRWWCNGSHAGFKSRCLRACGFDPHPAHDGVVAYATSGCWSRSP